jgi:hypothetical protein
MSYQEHPTRQTAFYKCRRCDRMEMCGLYYMTGHEHICKKCSKGDMLTKIAVQPSMDFIRA